MSIYRPEHVMSTFTIYVMYDYCKQRHNNSLNKFPFEDSLPDEWIVVVLTFNNSPLHNSPALYSSSCKWSHIAPSG